MNGPARITFTLLASLAGCAARQADDPSFNVTYDAAERELASTSAAADRPTLDRPLLILDGVGAWGPDPAKLKRLIAARVDGKIITVCYPLALTFSDCRRRLIAAVDRELGKGDAAGTTVEVDVIGQSMGGLVALFAALDDSSFGRRLNIRRLYTISSPLTGARRAQSLGWLSPIPIHRDLRPGSSLYARLAQAAAPTFPIVSYTRLQDDIVGARYASPPGQGVYWLSNRPWEHAHFGVMDDPRIVADLLRRLRGATPLTSSVPSPLPEWE